MIVAPLCQVLGSYNTLLELFSQRIWLLPLPRLSLRLRDELMDHLTVVLHPHCLLVSLRGVQKRLGKVLNSLEFSHLT